MNLMIKYNNDHKMLAVYKQDTDKFYSSYSNNVQLIILQSIITINDACIIELNTYNFSHVANLL